MLRRGRSGGTTPPEEASGAPFSRTLRVSRSRGEAPPPTSTHSSRGSSVATNPEARVTVAGAGASPRLARPTCRSCGTGNRVAESADAGAWKLCRRAGCRYAAWGSPRGGRAGRTRRRSAARGERLRRSPPAVPRIALALAAAQLARHWPGGRRPGCRLRPQRQCATVAPQSSRGWPQSRGGRRRASNCPRRVSAGRPVDDRPRGPRPRAPGGQSTSRWEGADVGEEVNGEEGVGGAGCGMWDVAHQKLEAKPTHAPLGPPLAHAAAVSDTMRGNAAALPAAEKRTAAAAASTSSLASSRKAAVGTCAAMSGAKP